MSSSSDFSNIPLDILSKIIKRLDVPDFLRSGAVCKTWRNLPRRNHCNKTQIPWLMFSCKDKVDYQYFYSMTEKKNYGIYLLDIDGNHCLGYSQGFLISVDKIADLHATNPITGTHIPLPPTSNSPGVTGVVTDPKTGQITHYIQTRGVDYYHTPVSRARDCQYKKAILSPSADIAVAICFRGEVAYTCVGDNKWTALDVAKYMDFNDATFHKGRLHAITGEGTIAIFDGLGGGKSTFVSLEGPLSSNVCPMRYLVESPDGEDLFLVYQEIKMKVRPTTVDVRVFLLDKATYTWNQMTSLGDVALFLGINRSMSLCTREHPGLKGNSVYFTGNIFTYPNEPELAFACETGVFNLEDGSIEPIYIDSNLDRLARPEPIWFMPTLS